MHHPDIPDTRSEADKARSLRYRDPARGRPAGGPSMGDTLRREVRLAERRLELAQDQLRRWLLSHGNDETPDVGPRATNDDEVV